MSNDVEYTDQRQHSDVATDEREATASASPEKTTTGRAREAIDTAFENWKADGPKSEKQLFHAFQTLGKIAVWVFYGRSNEDLVQEIVCKAFLNLGKFQDRSRVSTWFYSIATNECQKALREISKERKMVSISSDSGSRYAENDIEDTRVSLDDLHRRIDIKNLAKDLPEEQRRVIRMSLEGYSLEEIAQVENEPIGTVRGRYRLAKDKIRAKLRLFQPSTARAQEQRSTANDIKCVELDLISIEDTPAQVAPVQRPLTSYESIPEEGEDECSVGGSYQPPTSQLSA